MARGCAGEGRFGGGQARPGAAADVRPLRETRGLSAAAVAFALVLWIAPAASSEEVVVVGVDGPPGADGAPMEPGSPGAEGGAAVATADSPTDPVNDAQATGGAGGDGGRGGDGMNVPVPPFFRTFDGQPGGDGGIGGEATATATRGTSTSPFGGRSEAIAVGGAGGNGGAPGTPSGTTPPSPFNRIGTTGQGGRGGDARAALVDGPGSVATGGGAEARGGAGGHGYVGGEGGTGWASIDVSDDTAVIGFGAEGRGGDGGAGTDEDGSTAGRGGLGLATGRITGEGVNRRDLFLDAQGGRGGTAPTGENAAGGRGGDARAEFDVEGRHVSIRASSEGGDGGSATGVGRVGGEGGSASAEGSLAPTDGTGAFPRREVFVSGTGGNGGLGIDGARGGDGGSVDLGGIEIADGDDTVSFRQSATGGRGGQSSSSGGGVAGSGGSATSRANQALSADHLSIETTANGGDAGTGRGIDATSRGGDAFATAGGVNATGSVDVTANANGGRGGRVIGRDGGSAGLSGNATAIASGTAIAGGASATSRAAARGGNGGDSDGGAAGVGGGALADSTATSLGNGSASSEAVATSRTAGRLSRFGSSGQAADGRDGANNVARASSTTAGAGSASASASAAGGNGADAYGAGRRAGDGGSGTSNASAITQTGGVAVETSLRGGDGGEGLNAALGGHGGDAFSRDSVSGSTAGRLQLTQSVFGGRGGEGMVGGEGGDATSLLTARNLGGGELRVDVSADAGAGGVGAAGRAKSGDVRLGVHATGAQDVTIEAAADIGPGSALLLDPIHGASTGDGDVFVRLQVDATRWAGRGNPGDDGEGVDVTLDNAVSGESAGGRTTLWQRALAGTALDVTDGSLGDGGDATSRMTGEASGESVVNADSYGGNAHTLSFFEAIPQTDQTGRGGDATTEVDYSTSDGDLVVHAGARAGDGGGSNRVEGSGEGGLATVRADVVVGSGATHGATIGGAEPRRFSDPQVGAYGGRGLWDADGGNATSESRMTSFAVANTERHQVTDRAVGGDGGTEGGDGGDASSFAELLAAGDEALSVTSEATGGAGWLGGRATARAHGESPTGDVTVTAVQTSGDSERLDVSGIRTGRDSTMSNAASGGTAGVLRITQTAVAGSGSSRDAAAGDSGNGGVAASVLTEGNTGGGRLIANLSATGGNGGRAVGSGFFAGSGGDAVAAVVLDDVTNDVSVDLEATGGDGGLSAGGANVFSGGSAGFRDSSITALSNQNLNVDATARSGDGGSRDAFQGVFPADGGSAQDVVLENAVHLQTEGQVNFEQTAVGGDGGGGVTSGGDGGNARSVLRRIDTGSSVERLTANAEAGSGGIGTNGRAGRAGNAHAEIEARSSTAILDLEAKAVSGGTDLPRDGSDPASAGDATVEISGTVVGDGLGVTIGSFVISGADFGAEGAQGAGWGSSGSPSFDLESAGRGGNAESRSTGLSIGDSRVLVRDRAVGGEGGRSRSTGVAAGDGGNATSIASARSDGSSRVEASAEAIGGLGGSEGNARAVGGMAYAEASGTSTGDGEVTVSARQTAGTLRDSTMMDQVSGSTAGELTLTQVSTGGHGGGAGSSALTASNPAGGALTMRVEAIGGAGDRTRDLAGIAASTAHGLDTAGATVDVRSTATAGNAFQAGDGAAASAVGTANGAGRALSYAEANAGFGRGATGAHGASLATATADGVELASARASMTRAGRHDGTAAATLRPVTGPVTSARAQLRTTGESQGRMNMQSEVAARGAEPGPPAPIRFLDATIDTSLGTPDEVGRIAEVDIVLSSASGASGWSQQALVELAISTTGSPLVLVFGEWSGSDVGIESIDIDVAMGDETIVDETFDDLFLALSFLSGSEFALGGGSGLLRTSIRLESAATGDSLLGGFALVVVPEPSTALLLVLGLGGLAAVRAR